MTKPIAVTDQPWYTVQPPWGDGTSINAGSADPHQGTLVVDLQIRQLGVADEQWRERAELADYLVKIHNTDLARRVLERLQGVRD